MLNLCSQSVLAAHEINKSPSEYTQTYQLLTATYSLNNKQLKSGLIKYIGYYEQLRILNTLTKFEIDSGTWDNLCSMWTLTFTSAAAAKTMSAFFKDIPYSERPVRGNKVYGTFRLHGAVHTLAYTNTIHPTATTFPTLFNTAALTTNLNAAKHILNSTFQPNLTALNLILTNTKLNAH